MSRLRYLKAFLLFCLSGMFQKKIYKAMEVTGATDILNEMTPFGPFGEMDTKSAIKKNGVIDLHEGNDSTNQTIAAHHLRNKTTTVMAKERGISNEERTNVVMTAPKIDPGKDFLNELLRIATTPSDEACPLNRYISHEKRECKRRQFGVVCVFPDVIIKRVERPKVWDMEKKAFEMLNDTRYFPELFYRDDNCKTMLIENVRAKGKRSNVYSADFSFYKDFFTSLFEIFNANSIRPTDLNTCCNVIVNGEDIHVIDFGKYELNQDPTTIRQNNVKFRDRLLKNVKKATEKNGKVTRPKQRKGMR